MKTYNPWYLFVNFQRGLYNADGTVSSKRVAGIMVLIVTIIMALGSQFSASYKMDYAVFVTYIGFVLACFGMNTALTAKAMAVKENVATDMVDSGKIGANDDAKAVLNSDKP